MSVQKDNLAMSSPQSMTIEMLDQLFANHFGVQPIMARKEAGHEKDNSSISSSSLSSSYSSSSTSSTSQRHAKSVSFSSRSSSDSNNTSQASPTSKQLSLPSKDLQNNKDSSSTAAAATTSMATMTEGEKKVKMTSLLQALTDLYATPLTSTAMSSNTPRDQGNAEAKEARNARRENIFSIYCDAEEGDDYQRPSFATLDQDISPKSVRPKLPEQDKEIKIHSNPTSEQQQQSNGNGEEATIWPVDHSVVHEVDKPEDVGIISARRPSRISTNDVRPMGPLTQIHYKVESLPRSALSQQAYRDALVQHFPQLCEAPHTVMFDDQGVALPPLKYEETTEEERKARKEALTVHVRGKKMHTLIKSTVVVESRSTHWKKTGSQAAGTKGSGGQKAKSNPASAPALPELPSAWNMSFLHSDDDTLSIKGTARRTFELSESRAFGQCPKCLGDGLEACTTCKGSAPDECFWCDGTGREKRRQRAPPCKPCTGSGKLVCQTCDGKLRLPCKTCDGQGQGEFCAYVQIKVRRVDFTPVPLSSVIASGSAHDAEAVQTAARERTWDVINQLTEASKVKHKNPFRPLAASCACQTSWSDLVEVHVSQATSAKALLRTQNSNGGGAGGGSLLKRSWSLGNLSKAAANSEASQKRAPIKKRFFVLPSDKDLQPAEINEGEFELALIPPMTLAASSNVGGASAAAAAAATMPNKGAVAQRSVPMSHQRSHSERLFVRLTKKGAMGSGMGDIMSSDNASVTSGEAGPSTRATAMQPSGSNDQDVVAWRAHLQRPISPMSQPGTPDCSYGYGSGAVGNSGSSTGGYFASHHVLPANRPPHILAQRNGFDSPSDEVPPSHFTTLSASPPPTLPKSAAGHQNGSSFGALQMQFKIEQNRAPSAASSVSGNSGNGSVNGLASRRSRRLHSPPGHVSLDSYGKAF